MFRKQPNVLLAAVFVLATTFFSASSLVGQSAFAKVRGDGTVASFGGTDATNASAVHSSVGQYTVTFDGTFSPTITPDSVVINTTAESFNYGVTNAFVISANPAQIVVYVYVWTSSNLVYLDNAIFVTLNVGSAPAAPASAAIAPK